MKILNQISCYFVYAWGPSLWYVVNMEYDYFCVIEWDKAFFH